MLPGMSGRDRAMQVANELRAKNQRAKNEGGRRFDDPQRLEDFPEFHPDVVARHTDETLREMRADLAARKQRDQMEEAMGLLRRADDRSELEETA